MLLGTLVLQSTYIAAACAALKNAQGCTVWLPALLCPAGCTWLLHIVTNTLHPLLLERSLLLLAAMLAVTAETAAGEAGPGTAQARAAAEVATPSAAAHPAEESDHAAVQQQHGTAMDTLQLLLQHGFLPALEAVLLPAAAPGTQLQEQQQLLLQQANQAQANSQTGASAAAAAAGVCKAGGGGWSEDDSPPATAAADGAGDDSAERQCANRVYQQPEVLLALLSCLEQLGQEGRTAAVVLQQMPGLPQQLLCLMLACRAKEQQSVLELLLPVLVLFRAGVVPCLTLGGVQSEDSDDCQEGLPKQQQLQQRALCLPYWVCIAGVLSDCGPESLDAIDAAWYLLAAVMSSAQPVLAQLLLLQTGSNSLSTHSAEPSPAWIQQQFQKLCRCVVESTVPATARNYARKCVLSLQAALQDVQQKVAGVALQEALRICADRLETLQ
jgi:hypothetical protein